MTIEEKKIKVVQDILKLENEEVLAEIEGILKSRRLAQYESSLVPMSKEELENRVNSAVSDVKSGRYSSSKSILKKFGS